METLIIETTIQTPYICFDPDNNKFEISGKSLPEDADEFYQPIVQWIDKYVENPAPKTDFHFKMDYYNTASSRYISRIVHTLDEMAKKNSVKIFWYYRSIDEDMESMGDEFYETTDLDFELVEIQQQ
jgi:hypothetical protein